MHQLGEHGVRIDATATAEGVTVAVPVEEPDGIPFACDATFLRQMQMVNLTTRYGDLDLSFAPAGTAGFEDLRARAVRLELRDGIVTYVAALEDIIRSKEAANREKDRLALPTLRLLLQKIREGQPPPVE